MEQYTLKQEEFKLINIFFIIIANLLIKHKSIKNMLISVKLE